MARNAAPICISVTPLERSYIDFLTNETSLFMGKAIPASRIINTLIHLAVTESEISFALHRDLAAQYRDPEEPAQDPDPDPDPDLGYEDEIRT